jgi:glycosyltransferase involved in cell wall biosynthesis
VNLVPTISVVIPTRSRPDFTVRAVKSALAQTITAIEVVVVIDGPEPDDRTAATLRDAIKDDRLTIIRLPHPVGGSEARNAGIRASRGEFIALLDDDDQWSQYKLARQLELARESKEIFPVVTCRLIARRPTGDEMWPARPIGPGESMSEYLFCRESSIRQGEGFIQSSTLFAPRALMLQVPFASNLPRHQDWDWLIRASVHPGVEFLWVWDPLVIYHIDRGRKSVSGGRSLAASENWVDGNRLVTPKAKAYFYATQIAVRCNTPSAFWLVVRSTFSYPRAFLIAMGLALTPRALVDLLRPRRVLTHA